MPKTELGLVLPVLSARVYQHPQTHRCVVGWITWPDQAMVLLGTGYLKVVFGVYADGLNT